MRKLQFKDGLELDIKNYYLKHFFRFPQYKNKFKQQVNFCDNSLKRKTLECCSCEQEFKKTDKRLDFRYYISIGLGMLALLILLIIISTILKTLSIKFFNEHILSKKDVNFYDDKTGYSIDTQFKSKTIFHDKNTKNLKKISLLPAKNSQEQGEILTIYEKKSHK